MGYLATLLLGVVSVHVSCLDNTSVILNAIRRACPYSNFCQWNAILPFQDDRLTPCCTNCSCADDCWIRDNCCPDNILTADTSTTIKETCKSTYVLKQNEDSFISGDFKRKTHYFVTESCPKWVNDELLRKKCNGTAAETVVDLTWVSDMNTNKIYRNRYCAECHGVQNYTHWDLLTDCFDLMLKENYSLDISSFPETCLYVTPPNERALENECLLPDISTCNQTGLWDVKDDLTETLCQSLPMLFVEERMGYIANVYRNIFCFKCNKPQGTIIEDKCIADIFYHWIMGSFTGILDIADVKQTEHKKMSCAMDEVEDPLKGSCLKLACPISQFPRYGTCQRRFTTTRNLAISITYRLHTNWDKTIYGGTGAPNYKYSDIDIGLATIYQILQALGIEHCGTCYEKFYKSIIDRTIGSTRLSHYFDFTASINVENPQCSQELLVDAMTKLDEKEVNVNIKYGEYITFDIKEIKDLPVNQANTTQVILPYIEMNRCTTSYKVNYRDLNHCPTVNLDDDLHSSLMNRAKSVGKFSLVKALSGANFGPNTLPTHFNTTSVCLDEYRKTVSLLSSSSNSSLKLAEHIVVLTALLLMWFVRGHLIG